MARSCENKIGDSAIGLFGPADLSIYVHFPFCRQKCHFCDWVQRIPKSDLLRSAGDSKRASYVDALCREIRERGSQLSDREYRPAIVYWGGGTSTSMEFGEVEQVVRALDDAFDLSQVREWTIEGSPDTVSIESLTHYRELGFNRFSVGIQSFDDGRLRKLGRRHDSRQAYDAVAFARTAGFDNVSIDLMCGFADESLDEVERNVVTGAALRPNHLSLYTFRPTEGTVMRRAVDKQQVKLEVGRQLAAYRRGRSRLRSEGFQEYGVGYFGRPAENVVGMFQMRCDVVGFGSGAVSVFGQTYRGHTSGLLDRYIADSLNYDFEQSLLSPGVALSMLRSGLSIHGGIRGTDWEARVGENLSESLDRPELASLTRFLSSIGGLDRDEHGISLVPERADAIVIGMVNKLMLASAKCD